VISKNGNQGSLYLYIMPRGFFQIVCSVPSLRAGRCRKCARPCSEKSWRGFSKQNTNKSRKIGTHKQVNCNQQNRQDRACTIELADLGFDFYRAKSVLPPAYVVNRVLAIRLGQTLTLSFCLSQLLLILHIIFSRHWWILHWDTEGIEPTREETPVSYGLRP